MGKYDTCMKEFLQNKNRFADLFNGCWFQGKPVILAEDLQDASETKSQREKSPVSHFQFSAVTADEKLSGILKTDRLQPVYTLCLYTGTDPWDDPRMLSDMMAFNPKDKQLRFLFKDYPLNLFCINEHDDFSKFHTDLKELFQVINCRKDKEKLAELIQNQAYSHLSEETWDAIATMTNNTDMVQNKKLYKNTNGEQEKFNMCQALEELMEDNRNEGARIGEVKGKRIGEITGVRKQQIFTIRQMLNEKFELKDICRIVGCDPALIEEVKTESIKNAVE